MLGITGCHHEKRRSFFPRAQTNNSVWRAPQGLGHQAPLLLTTAPRIGIITKSDRPLTTAHLPTSSTRMPVAKANETNSNDHALRIAQGPTAYRHRRSQCVAVTGSGTQRTDDTDAPNITAPPVLCLLIFFFVVRVSCVTFVACGSAFVYPPHCPAIPAALAQA